MINFNAYKDMDFAHIPEIERYQNRQMHNVHPYCIHLATDIAWSGSGFLQHMLQYMIPTHSKPPTCH